MSRGDRGRGIFLAVVVVLAIVVGCSATGCGVTRFGSMVMQDGTVLKRNVVVADRDAFRIVEASSNHLQVETEEPPEVGDVIVSTRTDAAPEGVLARVISVEMQDYDEYWQIGVEPAALTDAIESCDVHEVAFLSEYGASTFARSTLSDPNAEIVSTAATFHQWTDNYGASGNVRVNVDLVVRGGKVDLSVTTSIDGSIDLFGGGEFDDTLTWDEPISFVIYAGGVPIPIQAEVGVRLVRSGQADGCEVWSTYNLDARQGFTYTTDDGVSLVNEDASELAWHHVSPSENSLSSDANTTADVSVGLIVGNCLSVSTYVTFDGDDTIALQALVEGEPSEGAIALSDDSEDRYRGDLSQSVASGSWSSLAVMGGTHNLFLASDEAAAFEDLESGLVERELLSVDEHF